MLKYISKYEQRMIDLNRYICQVGVGQLLQTVEGQELLKEYLDFYERKTVI